MPIDLVSLFNNGGRQRASSLLDVEAVLKPWTETNRVHDWRNHVPDCLEQLWGELPLVARVAVYVIAERAASDEVWE